MLPINLFLKHRKMMNIGKLTIKAPASFIGIFDTSAL